MRQLEFGNSKFALIPWIKIKIEMLQDKILLSLCRSDDEINVGEAKLLWIEWE
jgi:hypothetical protein